MTGFTIGPRTRVVFLALVAVIAAGAGWYAWRSARRAQPGITRAADQNVLLITIDTLRADALGCYGGPASTPALDALAASGERFTFAHAHAVTTLPAHASILTGLNPYAHGVHDNSGFRLKDGIPTVATLLASNGFATAAFVGAFPLDHRFGLARGFDAYDDRVPSGGADVPVGIVMPERRADAVVSLARDWIGRQPGRWFAWVHVFDPHAPYAPPAPYDQEYAGRQYHGEVAFTDRALAPLLDQVSNGSRPTLVIVTGDHGEGLGEHGELTHGVFAYEATLRVPLIVSQAGGSAGARAGAVNDSPARHVDVLPTVLDALMLPSVPSLHGRTLLNRDGDAGTDTYFEAMMPALTRGWAPLSGVLVGRRKLIDLPIAELYDLEGDPSESRNLADKDSNARRTLEARLRGFGAGPLPGATAEDVDAAARLRALGYTSGSAPRKPRFSEDDDPKRLIGLDRDLHLGLQLHEQGRYAEAIDRFTSVVNRRPAMTATRGYLANTLWESGDRPGAIAALERAPAALAASPELRRQLGIYLAESGRPQRALELLDPAAADPDTLNAIGIALARAGNAGGAEEAFTRVLRQNPSNALALQNLGTLQLERNQGEDAVRSFERALAVDPNLGEAWTGLGVARMRLGAHDLAFDVWRRAVEINPRNFDALYNLSAELINSGRFAEAAPYARHFVKTAPPALYGPEIARIQRFLASGRQ